MNGFVNEMLTQGDDLKRTISFYKNEGKAIIDEIAELYKANGMDRIILTGMGSSLYALNSICSYLTNNGIPTNAYSSFELSRYQFPHVTDKTLVIAVSQSGNTWEVIELVEKAQKITKVVGMYNNAESKLAQIADIKVPIGVEKEYTLAARTYEISMLIANIIAHKLVDKLDDEFWAEVDTVTSWCCDRLDNWEANAAPMYEFAKGTLLFDLLANNASLATARQLSLAYREGLRNCTAAWEHADFAHGQYQSSRMGGNYLAQMFFPTVEEDTKETKMLNFVLGNGGKVILYTPVDYPARENLYIVKIPAVDETLLPLAESIAAEGLLAMLLGPEWKMCSPA